MTVKTFFSFSFFLFGLHLNLSQNFYQIAATLRMRPVTLRKRPLMLYCTVLVLVMSSYPNVQTTEAISLFNQYTSLQYALLLLNNSNLHSASTDLWNARELF